MVVAMNLLWAMSTRRLYTQVFGGRILRGGGNVEREVQVRNPKLPQQQPQPLKKTESWKKQQKSATVPAKLRGFAECLELANTYFADRGACSGGQPTTHSVSGLNDLVRSWNNGKGSLLPETLAYLDNVAWSKLWTNPEHHDFLKSIICIQPHRFQELARTITNEPGVAMDNRTTAARLFSSIFAEVGARDMNLVESWLSELAPYRQLCPPELWTLDFLDSCKLSTNVAKKYIQHLSYGPSNWRLHSLNAFVRSRHVRDKGSLTLEYLLSCAASGARFTLEEMKKEIKRTLDTTLATQRLCCLAWIASNNGHDSAFEDCVQHINLAKVKSKRQPLPGKRVESPTDAMACCLQMGKASFIHRASIILTHSVEPFGSPARAGVVLGNVYVDQAGTRSSPAAMLPALCLALEPVHVVQLLDAFLSTIEESRQVNGKQLAKLAAVFRQAFPPV